MTAKKKKKITFDMNLRKVVQTCDSKLLIKTLLELWLTQISLCLQRQMLPVRCATDLLNFSIK